MYTLYLQKYKPEQDIRKAHNVRAVLEGRGHGVTLEFALWPGGCGRPGVR